MTNITYKDGANVLQLSIIIFLLDSHAVQCPTVSNLTLLTWTDQSGQRKKLQIIEEMSNEWKRVGRLLGLSMSTISHFEDLHPNGNVRCCELVFNKWINNNGYPPNYYYNWDGVCELLADMGHHQSAEDLSDALESHQI